MEQLPSTCSFSLFFFLTIWCFPDYIGVAVPLWDGRWGADSKHFVPWFSWISFTSTYFRFSVSSLRQCPQSPGISRWTERAFAWCEWDWLPLLQLRRIILFTCIYFSEFSFKYLPRNKLCRPATKQNSPWFQEGTCSVPECSLWPQKL